MDVRCKMFDLREPTSYITDQTSDFVRRQRLWPTEAYIFFSAIQYLTLRWRDFATFKIQHSKFKMPAFGRACSESSDS